MFARPKAVAGVLSTLFVFFALAGVVQASSHREAPGISEDPVADNTDLYAFVDPIDTSKVTIIANWIPFEEPAGGPIFYEFGDEVRYDLDIDNNGDGVEDITFQFRFTTHVGNPASSLYATGQVTSLDDADLNVRQTYDVFKVQKKQKRGEGTLGLGLATAPINVGPRSTPSYATLADAAVHTLPGDITVFAGQRADAFFYDQGAVADLVGLRPFNSLHVLPLVSAAGRDTMKGFNVHTIAIQVPKTLVVGTDPVIGIWSSTYRHKSRSLSKKGLKHSGGWQQISRLGMPFVNELVIPRAAKDLFNVSKPKDDAQFLNFIFDPEPGRALFANYPIFSCVPTTPRTDLKAIFMTGISGVNQPANVHQAEMLRLNTAVAPTAIGLRNRLGLLGGQPDGFPNGRRLEDDVVDIELRIFAGASSVGPCSVGPNNQLGDGVDAPSAVLLGHFPYMPLPYQGYDHTH